MAVPTIRSTPTTGFTVFTWSIDEREHLIGARRVLAEHKACLGKFALMDTDYFKPAVARGAEWLDGLQEWRPRIDLQTLNLADATRCVLGQLYGDYNDALDRLTLPADGAVRLGFAIGGSSCVCCATPEEQMAWDSLTEAWRLELSTV